MNKIEKELIIKEKQNINNKQGCKAINLQGKYCADRQGRKKKLLLNKIPKIFFLKLKIYKEYHIQNKGLHKNT